MVQINQKFPIFISQINGLLAPKKGNLRESKIKTSKYAPTPKLSRAKRRISTKKDKRPLAQKKIKDHEPEELSIFYHVIVWLED